MHDRAARQDRSPPSPDDLEIAALRDRQRARLLLAIATDVGDLAFNAGELWRRTTINPDLRAAFERAGITSARRLGKRLQQLQDARGAAVRLTRIGHDNGGAIWEVTIAADRHLDDCEPIDAGV